MLGHALSASAQVPEAGEVVFAKGITTAQIGGGPVRLLAAGSKLFQGDVITTANRSFAVVKFIDDTRMTLRPNTVFRLDEYQFRDEQSSAALRLFKGGLRAVTGAISKRTLDGYRVNTAVATIGIRGTEFEARLCAEDCQEEAARTQTRLDARPSSVVARVVLIRGQATLTNAGGVSRPLVLGASLVEGDLIETLSNTILVVAFRDNTRMTIQPNSRLEVSRFRFRRDQPGQGSALMRLLRGGLRTFSGLIADERPEAFKVETPAATIGIRGTGFDTICQGNCVTPGTAQKAPEPSGIAERLLDRIVRAVLAQIEQSDGLYLSVWQGDVILELATGNVIISQGSAVFVPNDSSPPIPLPQIPVFIQEGLGPRPDTPESSDPGMQNPFGAIQQNQPERGLYVHVFDGEVTMHDAGGNRVDLGNGETGFAGDDEQRVVRIERPPRITATFTPGMFDDPQIMEIFELFEDVSETPQTEFECVVR